MKYECEVNFSDRNFLHYELVIIRCLYSGNLPLFLGYLRVVFGFFIWTTVNTDE